MTTSEQCAEAKIFTRGNTVCVRFFGRIGEDPNQGNSLKEKLYDVMKTMGTNLVIDFEHVEMVSSFGMSMLGKVFKRVQSEGGTVRLINVPENIYSALELMELTKGVTVELTSGKVL